MKINTYNIVDRDEKEVDVRQHIKNGALKLAKAVKATLGPKGRLVAVETSPYEPLVLTQDGVTVARNFALQDRYEQIGVRIMKQVSEKADKRAGDGTTTATVLAEALLNQVDFNTSLFKPDSDNVTLKKELEDTGRKIISRLDEKKRNIETADDVYNVALVSSLDPHIAGLIKEAYEKVGKDGVINFEKGRELETKVEVSTGFEIPSGYISTNFITESDGTFKLEDTYVIVTNEHIERTAQIQALITKAIDTLKINKLVILADSFDNAVVKDLIHNKIKGTFTAIPIKTPSIGENNRNYCRDIALALGARFLDKDLGLCVETATVTDLGFAKSVKGSWNYTIFTEGNGDKALIQKAVNDLKTLATVEKTNDLITERIARLSSGVATITIGGVTETEIDERKYKVEDAVNAVKTALKEGIVDGGGYAFAMIATELEGTTRGEIMFAQALQYPLIEIANNAGYSGTEVAKKVTATKEGFNAVTGEYGDLGAMGIVDPVKVLKNAVIGAISVVSQIANIKGVIIKEKDEKLTDFL